MVPSPPIGQIVLNQRELQMELKEESVIAVLSFCLYNADEVECKEPTEENVPDGAVVVEGIKNAYGFHPDRLKASKRNIADLLNQLPEKFRNDSGSGGYHFTAGNQDRNERDWTGNHGIMEAIYCLGMGVKMVQYCAPRSLWGIMPGKLPFLVFDGEAIDKTLAEEVQ